MPKPSDGGDAGPGTLDERLALFVRCIGQMVSERHAELGREALFELGLYLGLHMGLANPGAASRYAEAVRGGGLVEEGEFSRKMAEALELLAGEAGP